MISRMEINDSGDLNSGLSVPGLIVEINIVHDWVVPELLLEMFNCT